MSSSTSISEFNGSGATEAGNRTEGNYKAIDDSNSPYGSYPINPANNENSYSKYWALKYTGSWSSISAVSVKANTNAPAVGVSITGAVVTSYATPSRTATGDSPMSTSGLSLNLVSSSSAFGTGTSSSTAGGTMYTQAIRTQLQSTSSYGGGPGDMATPVSYTWSWTES